MPCDKSCWVDNPFGFRLVAFFQMFIAAPDTKIVGFSENLVRIAEKFVCGMGVFFCYYLRTILE